MRSECKSILLFLEAMSLTSVSPSMVPPNLEVPIVRTLKRTKHEVLLGIIQHGKRRHTVLVTHNKEEITMQLCYNYNYLEGN